MSADTPAGGFDPNGGERKQIRFIDSRYNTLFHVPDGGGIVLTALDGESRTRPCQYLDDTHVRIGGETFHICEFAEYAERNSVVYAPEHPQKGDICDTYTIYQLKDMRETPYGFAPYEQAKGKLRMSHYQRAYRGVLAPKVTLEDLYAKHNRDNRPFGRRMRSLSMSDVVVLDRGGQKKAYYVDTAGFQEVKHFLDPPDRKTTRPSQER